MRRILSILLFLFVSATLFADGPEFDVASIKAIPPNPNGMIFIGPARGGPGTADPTHITWPSATLKQVVMNAFDVKNFQVSGPDVLDSERFEFAVAIPEGATKEQVAQMWKNLLISRFGLKFHIEQREFTVDQLQVGPKGHKLVENTDAPPEPQANPSNAPFSAPPKMDKDGRPVMDRPGMLMMMTAGPSGPSAKMTAKGQAVSELVTMLSNQLGHPVVDKTGLTGKYDFNIDFTPTTGPMGAPMVRGAVGGLGVAGGAPPQPGAAVEMGLELPQAVEQQLGLRLVKGKGMLDVVVVEKVNRVPTEN